MKIKWDIKMNIKELSNKKKFIENSKKEEWYYYQIYEKTPKYERKMHF